MNNVLLLLIGGGVGTLLRYGISVLTFQSNASQFPFDTFLVNMIGCLGIGVAMSLLMNEAESNWARLFFVIGLLGGFTTFSSFAFEGLTLFQSGQTKLAILYMVLTNVLGLLLVFVGIKIANLLS